MPHLAVALLASTSYAAAAWLGYQHVPFTPTQGTHDLVRPPSPGAAASGSSRSALDAVCMGRKGRPTMPQGMGGPQQMQARSPDVPSDGTPIFYLYCRTGPGKPWYPVSAMKGDGQSKGLVNAWLNSPLAKGVFKDRLDEGMARSIFDSERRLADMAVEQYRQLRDAKARLQWGFKAISKEILVKEASGEIEKVKIVPVNKGMINNGVLEQAQAAASGLLRGEGGGAAKDGATGGFSMPKLEMPKLKNPFGD